VHRRGYGASTDEPTGSVAADAADCLAVFEGRARLVASSSGCATALEMAVTAPDRVESVLLYEPPLPTVPAFAAATEGLAPVLAAWADGDAATAVDLFLTAMCGSDWRRDLDRAVPGAAAAAERDAHAAFDGEFPGMFGWTPRGGYDGPLRVVRGADAAPWFRESATAVAALFPQAETVVLAGATHLAPTLEPERIAALLTFAPVG
jgi:pimeloyl-ACP methyl ester carboxylesterase